MTQTIVESLLEFLQTSPTPFHAVANMERLLESAGYTRLEESQPWQSLPTGGYYVRRSGSSLVAFSQGTARPELAGVRMIGAHTDSPCLKVKPQPEINRHGYLQLGVEVYGGALLNPWFDRDLSMAGRITYRDRAGALRSGLIDMVQPVAVIPSLAIHLDRDVNKKRTVNPQQHLPVLVTRLEGDDKPDWREQLLREFTRRHPAHDIDRILDYDLFLYDVEPPRRVGLEQEFIAGARLDNLLSCYLGLRALLDTRADLPRLLVCNDHEEVGSLSAIGAQGPFLHSVLERWLGGGELLTRIIDRSLLMSVDNAHGIHPNYSDKHDQNHGPKLNSGPVIKLNANQRYASNSETSALFRHLCEGAEIPLQTFVVRTDMACGSTIGPLTAGELGVRTLDLGVPQLAMHSIRELCGARDVEYLYRALTEFCAAPTLAVDS